MIKLDYKTLGTCIINSPMSPPSLGRKIAVTLIEGFYLKWSKVLGLREKDNEQ